MNESPATPNTNTSAPSIDERLWFNISDSWDGKKPKPGIAEWQAWASYYPTRDTVDEPVDHLVAGGSVLAAHFQANIRQEEYFVSQQLIIPDFEAPLIGDVTYADVLKHDFARKHFRLLMHTDSSGKVTDKNPHGYTRLRGLAVYDEPIEGLGRAKALNGVVLSLLYPLPVDKSFTKPTQPAHGSTNHVEPPYINRNAEPICVREIAGYLAPIAAAEMLVALAPPPVYTPVSGAEADALVADRYNNLLAKLRLAPDGEKNDTLTSIAYTVFGWAKGGHPGLTEEMVERDLKKIADDWGGDTKKSYKTIEKRRDKAPAMPFRGKVRQPPRISAQMRHPPPDPTASHSDYAQAPDRPKPLTLWQNALMLYTSDTYPVIAHYVLQSGQPDFSKTEYAAMAGVSYKTAEKRIDEALLWGSVSRLEILQDRGEGENTTCKKYKRDLHGAAVGERYTLTPDNAMPMIRSELWKAVLEKLERGIPDTIFKAEAAEAFPDQDETYAARLQVVTSAVAHSLAADEVMADDERLAVRIAADILRRADYDETPLTMDIDPANVTDVRRRAIESLVATEPSANWLQGSEMSWVAGAKRSAVPALIRTSRLTPSATPTLTPVMLPGKNRYAEALVAAKKNKGALASWIDADGKVIRGFTSSEPDNAAGVLINQGKTYARHERMEPMPAAPKAEQQTDPLPLTPEQEVEQAVQRATRRARAGMMLRIRGCMRAAGYRYVPGPYGFWERREKGKPPQFAENTCEGMADALVADYERVKAEQDAALIDDLGAEVQELTA